MTGRVVSKASTIGLVCLTVAALLLSIAIVNDHNFDEPPVPVGLIIAAVVLLLVTPGLAWPSSRLPALLAIVVLVAMTVSILAYFEAWVQSCPSCNVGHDDSRESIHGNVLITLAIMGSIAIGITTASAAFSAFVRWYATLVRRVGERSGSGGSL